MSDGNVVYRVRLISASRMPSWPRSKSEYHLSRARRSPDKPFALCGVAGKHCRAREPNVGKRIQRGVSHHVSVVYDLLEFIQCLSAGLLSQIGNSAGVRR